MIELNGVWGPFAYRKSVKKNKILTQISSRTANFCILDPQGTWFKVFHRISLLQSICSRKCSSTHTYSVGDFSYWWPLVISDLSHHRPSNKDAKGRQTLNYIPWARNRLRQLSADIPLGFHVWCHSTNIKSRSLAMELKTKKLNLLMGWGLKLPGSVGTYYEFRMLAILAEGLGGLQAEHKAPLVAKNRKFKLSFQLTVVKIFHNSLGLTSLSCSFIQFTSLAEDHSWQLL